MLSAGTWNHQSTSSFGNNLFFSAGSNTITFGGNGLRTGSGTVTYVSGNMAGTKSLLAASTKFQTSGMTWDSMTTAGSNTITLNSNLYIIGQTAINTNLVVINTGGTPTALYTGGISRATSGSITGTAPIIFSGTGTWSDAFSSSVFSNDLFINTPGTLTLNGTVAHQGNITYLAGTVNTSGSTLSLPTTSMLDTSGMTWNNVTLAGTTTYTLNSNLNVGGNLTFLSGLIATINGNNLYVSGNINQPANNTSIGTTNIIMNGNGTWSGGTGSSIKNNLNINTTGTTSINNLVGYNTGTLSYSGGTVITTGSTLTIGASSTLNTNGISWNNITFPSINSTITLLSDLTSVGLITFPNIAISTAINGNKLNISGSLTQNNGNFISGSTVFLYNGTGTFNGLASGSYIDNPTNINTPGTLSIFGNFNIGGNLTYNSGSVSAGTSTLFLRNTINVNTNGINWYNLNIGATNNINLLSDLIISNHATLGTAVNVSLNGSNMYVGGNLIPFNGINVTGSTNIILNGTGVWSANTIGLIKNNLTINTTGTTTILGTVNYNTGTLAYSAGTVITTGSTLNMIGSTNLNTNGINWNNISVGGVNSTYNLLSDLRINNFTGANTIIFSGSNLYVGGNFTHTSSIVGSTNFILNGTGTFAPNQINTNVTINTTGTTTIVAGTTSYSTGTLAYSAGTVITTGSTLSIFNGATLNTNGVIWNNITFGGVSQTYSLLSDLYSSGITTFAGSGVPLLNGNKLYSVGNGSITSTAAAAYIAGTTNLILSGNSSLVGNAGGWNTTIVFAGNNNITNTIWLGGGTFINSGATVNAGTSILNRLVNLAPLNFDTSGITFNNLILSQAIGINSLLSAKSLSLGTTTFTGTSGFNVLSLSATTPSSIITIKSGITYNVTKDLTLSGTSALKITLQSSNTSPAFFNLQYGATQNVKNTNATWINSIGGQTIYDNAGSTLSNTTNWNIGTYYDPTNFFMTL